MHKNNGQTLLEVIVAVGVIAMLVTGLVIAVTTSLRYGESGRLRSVALKYSQGGIELVRGLRDKNTWDTFIAYSSVAGKLWCVDESGTFISDGGAGTCPINILGTYTRSIFIKWNNPLVEVTSTVSWHEGSETPSSTLKTYFTKWK